MSLETDLLLDRRRLKSRLILWRSLSVILLVVALLIGFGRMAGQIASSSRHIARLDIQGTIGTDSALERKIRALAVATPVRWPELPDVPTMTESGLAGFPSTFLYGLLAPKGTPVGAATKLNQVVNDILQSAEARTSFAKLGIEPSPGTPKDFGATLVEQAREWEVIVKETGIRME